MTERVRPIYEWTWHREGKPDMTTDNPRVAAAYKRAAEKFGGNVERRQVGFRLPITLREFMRDA